MLPACRPRACRQGGLMEAERVVSAAASMDTAVLTAKVGVAAVAAKSAFDFLTHSSGLLAAAGAVAVAAFVVVPLARAGMEASSAAQGSAGAPPPHVACRCGRLHCCRLRCGLVACGDGTCSRLPRPHPTHVCCR